MEIKTVDVVIQRAGRPHPGTEKAWSAIATADLRRWAEHAELTCRQAGLVEEGTPLVFAATGAGWWDVGDVVDFRTVKVDTFVWAQVRILEAERLREKGRPESDAVEAYRIVREVEREVTAHLRLHVAASVATAFGAHGGNYRRTGGALGISDTAVRNWLSGDVVKDRV